jgi:anti-anti-sigma factor
VKGEYESLRRYNASTRPGTVPRTLRLRNRHEEADMGLQILARKFGNVTILDVWGRILIGADADSFKAELSKLAESKPCDVLVNLADVTQMDSTGISTLVQSYVTLMRDGGSLKILNPTGYVREVLAVLGLDRCLPTYTDETEALASFRGSAARA